MKKLVERLRRCGDHTLPIGVKCQGCHLVGQFNCRGRLMNEAADAMGKSRKAKGAADGSDK